MELAPRRRHFSRQAARGPANCARLRIVYLAGPAIVAAEVHHGFHVVSQLTIRSTRRRFGFAVKSSASAARVSSGVSPADKDHLQRAQKELLCPTLAQSPAITRGLWPAPGDGC